MATQRSLFINVADLRAFTDIGPNYNERDLTNSVLDAQERELQNIIGKNLLTRFDNAIADGDILPTAYADLLDNYIKPFLIKVAYVNVLEVIYLTPNARGLGQRSSSPSFTPVSNSVYHQKRDQAQQNADHFGNKLVEYIENHYSEFAELSETALPSDTPQLEKQFSGNPLVFDRSKRTIGGITTTNRYINNGG